MMRGIMCWPKNRAKAGATCCATPLAASSPRWHRACWSLPHTPTAGGALPIKAMHRLHRHGESTTALSPSAFQQARGLREGSNIASREWMPTPIWWPQRYWPPCAKVSANRLTLARKPLAMDMTQRRPTLYQATGTRRLPQQRRRAF